MGGKTSSPVRVVKPSEAIDESDGHVLMRSRSEGADPDSVRVADSGSANKIGLRCNPKTGVYELEDSEGVRKRLSTEVVSWFKSRNSDTLKGSLAFVPWILQQSYFEGGLDDGKIVMHRGSGAVVFSDASGFTALTERLAVKSNGAELLSQCLTAFFTPLINLINAYRGDVIKFSGDALTIYFPAVEDAPPTRTRAQVPPHGSYGLPDLGSMTTAVLRASACCIEIHKRLHMFDTGVDNVRLCLHIGVGCGEITMLQVGGIVPPETHVPRFEYIIAGHPIEQISIAEPLAKNGETCLSPQAWWHVQDAVLEDTSRVLDRPDFHLLWKMNEGMYTFPTIKFSAMERDQRHEKQFKLSELNVIRRYIPSAVFKQIEGGTLTYVNEMRNISTIFVSGSGVDVSTDAGAAVAHDLMKSIQKVCYSHEGTLNKFVIDDKGMLFLLVFGLPPLVHTDDPTRAVLCCLEMASIFARFKLVGKFGVTTGRSYCGVCGSVQRMEYTVLGDPVNLSARLMANAPPLGVLIDASTNQLCTREIVAEELPAIKVKGKTNPIPIYRPQLRALSEFIGVDPKGSGKVRFPWYDRNPSMSGSTEEAVVHKTLKENVAQLCSLTGWEGIAKVQRLMGGEAPAGLHKQPAIVPSYPTPSEPRSRPPAESPFAAGGQLVIEGNTGFGKVELAEHIVLHAAQEFYMLPVFGTMGPRILDLDRVCVELLRSTLGVFRHIDSSTPESDTEAVAQILRHDTADAVGLVKEVLGGTLDEERRKSVLKPFADLITSLLEILRRKTAVLVVLQLEFGTNLFPKTLEHFVPFWSIVSSIGHLAEPSTQPGEKPVVVALFVKESDRSHPFVRRAIQNRCHIELRELSEASCIDYMAAYMRGSPDLIPLQLQTFISKLSLGNPLYIRETIDQLINNDFIKIVKDANGRIVHIKSHEDLESINIANWGQTAMVGNTICLLESLDPLESAVLKMSTCFEGSFTLPDLAASTCSRWAGATHFDYLRIFRAMQDLVKLGVLEVPPDSMPPPPLEGAAIRQGHTNYELPVSPPGSTAGMAVQGLYGSGHASLNRSEGSAQGGVPSTTVTAAKTLQTFEMRNVLIRKVGASMVLEAQRKVVKRQALIDRSLSRDLPARMEEVRTKRAEPHIPWYYENVLARGA